jgi:hypothetical protein
MGASSIGRTDAAAGEEAARQAVLLDGGRQIGVASRLSCTDGRVMTTETANTALPIRVIELAGLPGTGKSTIARYLDSAFRSAGVPTSSKAIVLTDQSSFVHRQRKRLQLIARNADPCGHLYRRSLRLVADSGQKSALDFAKVASNFCSIVALLAEGRAAGDRLMIADQGLVQAIWSVQLSSSKAFSPEAWKPLLFAAGMANMLLVHIQTDVSVSRYRVSGRTRNQTRLDWGSSDERSQRWLTAANNMSDLVEWARRTMPHDQWGGRVLSVTNHEGAPKLPQPK